MINLTTAEAMSQFSKSYLEVYDQQQRPTTFFNKMFKPKTVNSLFLELMVRRGDMDIAMDVFMGSRGNGNKFAKSTLKSYSGALFNEFFDHTELESFYRVFGNIDDNF